MIQPILSPISSLFSSDALKAEYDVEYGSILNAITACVNDFCPSQVRKQDPKRQNMTLKLKVKRQGMKKIFYKDRKRCSSIEEHMLALFINTQAERPNSFSLIVH